MHSPGSIFISLLAYRVLGSIKAAQAGGQVWPLRPNYISGSRRVAAEREADLHVRTWGGTDNPEADPRRVGGRDGRVWLFESDIVPREQHHEECLDR